MLLTHFRGLNTLEEANLLMAERKGVNAHVNLRKQDQRIVVALVYEVEKKLTVNVVITTNQDSQTVIYEAYTPHDLNEYSRDITRALSAIQ